MSLTASDKEDIRLLFMEGLEELVLPRFDGLENRMDKLEGRMDGLEVRMDRLEGRMNAIDDRMDGIEVQVKKQGEHTISLEAEMHRGFTEVNQRLESIDGRLEAVENDVKDMYKMLAELQRGGKELSALPLEKKIRFAHAQILAIAKEAGITLT